MNRAVLLIGVSRTSDGLGALQAVEESIDKMCAWAHHQLIPKDLIIRCTDATQPVTIQDLFNAVRKLADLGTIEQLIIYFAGHGVVNNRCEYWLLSDAPVNASAAVNVDNNISLAQGGPFEHVVLFSDACRTPTKDIQYGRIIGSDIFPNIEDAERERSVDIFFGTSLGAPALEVQQSAVTKQYQAVFTEALLDGLNGRIPECIVDGRVRPRPLKKVLPRKVFEKLKSSGLSLNTSQSPDARITSDDDAWIAEIRPPTSASSETPAGPDAAGAPPPPGAMPPPLIPSPPAGDQAPLMTTREVAKLVVDEAMRIPASSGAPITREEIMAIKGRRISPNADRFLDRMFKAETRALPAMPDRPGFEINGRAVASAWCPDGDCHIGQANTVSVNMQASQSQVLLEFHDGTSALLPVIAGFIGVLQFHETSLDEVWYDPANEFDASLSRQELDFLRQAIIKASALGVFSLEGAEADQLATRMQNLKFQDPALAIYAAYAFHSSGQFRRIGQMQEYLKSQLGMQLYDLALLSRSLLRDASLADQIVPRLPLLSQGWALIGALRGRMPSGLEVLRKELVTSLWSLYTPEGTRVIRAWLHQQGQETTVNMEAGV